MLNRILDALDTVVAHIGGSPWYNVAFEEAMLDLSPDLMEVVARVWINPDSVVIGYTLSPCVEVECGLAEALGIPVIRRVSGGGAVFHDVGNINVSLAIPRRLNVSEGYKLITGLILEVLAELGLKGHVENYNDVVVSGWKVSGSSLAIRSRSTLAHATLLVSSRMDLLKAVVKPRWDRVVRGEVTPAKYNPANISSLLAMNPQNAMQAALRALYKVLGAPWNDAPQGLHDHALTLCLEKYTKAKWSTIPHTPPTYKCGKPSTLTPDTAIKPPAPPSARGAGLPIKAPR